MKNNILRWVIKEDRGTIFSDLHFIGIVILLLSAGGIGFLLPPVISKMSPAVDKFGGSIGTFGPAFWGLIIGVLIMAVIIIFRQDEFAATVVVAASIILDWYLHIGFVALLMALVLLLVFFLARSPRYPWATPPALLLWLLFLVLIIFSATRGILTNNEALYFYPGITFGAFIMFWLGTVIARNVTRARLFFITLTGFGTLIAIHAIIQTVTGTFLFASSVNDSYYASLSNLILIPGLDTQRVGSFLLNPDWSGPFFAVMLFIVLGLFVESASILEKFLYLAETLLLSIALLFTYTFGAFIGVGAGIIVLFILIGRMTYRVLISLMLCLFGIVMTVFFSTQLALLQQRPTDSLIRVGAWQTAFRVISAYPLTGVGLGISNYLERAEPYRVAAQYIPLGHPLNSYLEFGVDGGLPVLLVFVALLLFALWLALRNWMRADVPTRALLGGCIAGIIALSIDSFTNNIWTIPPLATLGWLILGVISSPLLMKSRNSALEQDESNTIVNQSSEDRSLYV